MKRFLMPVVALLAGAVCTWGILQMRRPNADQATERIRALEAENGRLQGTINALSNRLAAASSTTAPVSTTPAPVVAGQGVRRDPREIIQILKGLRPSSREDRGAVYRLISFHYQSLIELGQASVPAIAEFFDQNIDLEYSSSSREGRDDNGRGDNNDARDRFRTLFRRNNPSFNFSFPPSLRIGLMQVLREIGGEPAETVLAKVVSSSARGVEVAYSTYLLNQMAGEKYREASVTAARELLLNPAPSGNSRLDRDNKDYLYWVLTFYKDPGFLDVAQQLLVGANGQLDPDALNYLRESMQEQAMPAIAAAFADARITNRMEKIPLLGAALDYLGKHPMANQMVTDVLKDQTIPVQIRTLTVQSLGGQERGPFRSETPKTPAELQARLQLLQEIRASAQEERLVRSLDEATERLRVQLSGGNPDDVRRSRTVERSERRENGSRRSQNRGNQTGAAPAGQ
jgi:hypothetical protein